MCRSVKKNQENIVQNIQINSNKPPEIIKKNKIDNADNVILDNVILDNVILDNENNKEQDKNIKLKYIKEKYNTLKENNKGKGKIKESNEPYKYNTKKDKPDVIWPSKNEIYNTETFKNKLIISLGIQPIFNIKTNPLSWLDWIINGDSFKNFFEGVVTDYNADGMSGNDWGWTELL